MFAVQKSWSQIKFKKYAFAVFTIVKFKSYKAKNFRAETLSAPASLERFRIKFTAKVKQQTTNSC